MVYARDGPLGRTKPTGKLFQCVRQWPSAQQRSSRSGGRLRLPGWRGARCGPQRERGFLPNP